MSKQNIDPINDIDFSAMGIMTQIVDAPTEDTDGEGGTPDVPTPQDTPPAAPAVTDPDESDEEEEDSTDTPPNGEGEGDEGGDKGDEKGNGEEEAPSVISEVINLIGFDDLAEEEFEDSVEGIGKLVQKASDKLAGQALDAIFNEFPEVKTFLEYAQNGGDLDKYHETRGHYIDYRNMEITDNESQQEHIIRTNLKSSNYSDDEVDGIIEKYKAGGILKDQAQLALIGLQRQSELQHNQMVERQAQEKQRMQEEIETFWKGVEQTLKQQDNFKGITIPKAERDEFFKYISKPVKDGYSQRDIDAQQLGLEEKIAIDYLIFRKFPLSELLEKKAATKNASDLRKRIKSAGDPKPSKTNPAKPSGGSYSVTDLDLM